MVMVFLNSPYRVTPKTKNILNKPFKLKKRSAGGWVGVGMGFIMCMAASRSRAHAWHVAFMQVLWPMFCVPS
jgi:hypothetical protein